MKGTGWREGSLELQTEAVAQYLSGTVQCDVLATSRASETHKNETCLN